MKKHTARLIIIAAIITIVVNGILISMLWSKNASTPARPPAVEEINSFIIEEIGYDKAQAEQFREISQRHHENQFELQMDYRNIKLRLNRAMVAQEDSVAHVLIEQLSGVVREKEKELFQNGEFEKITELIQTEYKIKKNELSESEIQNHKSELNLIFDSGWNKKSLKYLSKKYCEPEKEQSTFDSVMSMLWAMFG